MNGDKLRTMLELFSEMRSEQKVSGSWLAKEDKRNIDNLDLYEAMIRDAYEGVTMVVAGHHIMAMIKGEPLPLEVASPDTLIFDHYVAQKVWGDEYPEVLVRLAIEPASSRDALLRQLYAARNLT